jgi:hypothetical protein
LLGGYGTARLSTFTRGEKFFELSNHLGNVLATVTDKKLQHDDGSGGVDYYTADVATANDYYPGGMDMPGRTYITGSGYRYSINRQEKTPEIAPNTTTAEFWQYDARIVRRWNVDPVVKVWESSYLAFGGNPVLLSDPKGNTTDDWIKKKNSDESYSYTWNKDVTKKEETPAGYEYVGSTGQYYINETECILLGRNGSWNYGSESGGFSPYQNPPHEPANIPTTPYAGPPPEPCILAADMFGNGHIGARSVVEDQIGKYRLAYQEAVGENIKGGIFGAISYLVDGDRGSFRGAALDQAIVAGTVIKPARINTKPGPVFHSMYRDGTRVFEGEQPAGISASGSEFPHTVLRWDNVNNRIYQVRAYGMNNQALFDIDFTLPTLPNGALRSGHFVPEVHFYSPNPSGGTLRRSKQGQPVYTLDLNSGYNFRGNYVIKPK